MNDHIELTEFIKIFLHIDFELFKYKILFSNYFGLGLRY